MSTWLPPSNRSWVRGYFKDHPKLAQKAAEAYSGTRGTHDKAKVFCIACLAHRVNTILDQDAQEVEAGTRQVARAPDIIELEFFSIEQNDTEREWLAARIDGLVNHLLLCPYQPSDVRAKAQAHKDSTRPHRRSRRRIAGGGVVSPYPLPNFRLVPTLHVQTPSDTHESPYALAVSRPPAFPSYERESSIVSTTSSPSLTPFDSISMCSSAPGPLSRSRPPTSRVISLASPAPPDLEWSDARQKRFEERITRLTASAGLPLSWTENPEWLEFCTQFLPRAKSPSFKVLTQRLLPQTLAEIHTRTKQRVSGQNVTASCDGWTGENFHHYIALMITVGKEVHTVKFRDASNERKTVDNLYKLMVEVIESLQSEWKVVVVAFTMDASSEARKARKMLLAQFPHLVFPDCFAHQVNLVVGDYFKVETIYNTHSKLASELISWLRSKPYVLARLREIQVQSGRRPLGVIHAVLTRWTAHYLAFNRLLELQYPLQALVIHDAMAPSDQQFLNPPGSTTADKRKAHEMIAIIEDASFWHSLARLKTHLEPLARAANVAQAAFCRLDQTLLTFGSLCIYYHDIKMKDPANIPGCTAILDSIEKQWAKADQDVFIAAVILNPFVKTTAFSPRVPFVTRAGVLGLMQRLYHRFFSVTETTEELEEHMLQLFSNLKDYLGGSGICVYMNTYASAINDEAQRSGVFPDPTSVYRGIIHIDSDIAPPPLFKLAYHVLSICPNSASCEGLSSVFGNTLPKLRNSRGNQTPALLAELKMHIRNEHLRNGETKERMMRFFRDSQTSAPGTLAQPVSQQPSTSAPPPTDETETDDTTQMDIDMALDLTLQQPESPGGVADDFNRIIGSFGRQASEDENDEGGEMPSVISIEITELFDFAKRTWISQHERSASRSLDEELELYELLDSDTAGEEDTNVVVDHTLDSVLHHV